MKSKNKLKNKKKLLEENKKQIKLLKSVLENLITNSPQVIIDLLVGKKHVNEFEIAKNLGLTINQTRNILYKLSDYGIVSFIRKKDKRKGWYIYFWTLDTYHAFSLLEENLKKKLQELENQLKNKKENRYYFCNTCTVEVNEENALLNEFTCPECDSVYELSDNTKVINQIQENIEKIKKEIEKVLEERNKEGNKIEKEKKKKFVRYQSKKRKERISKSKEKKLLKQKKNKK